ncbi:hypothetical protein [uncultured Alistipes sp.]|uniref:hypothetical protein n=1 Tax=uncultured Alistipes sp. TaxID=538949 RepID=UPI0025D82A04|nr:hypothetical protein [uncultured Alistipes sp.]
MKNYILLLALTFATGAYCGTPYQDGSTVTANGITFKVENDKFGFALSNTANIYSHESNWRYKDGRKLETEDEYAVIDGTMKPGGAKTWHSASLFWTRISSPCVLISTAP